MPPLPPATLPQPAGQTDINPPAVSPMPAPQDQQAPATGNTVSMDQLYAKPAADTTEVLADEGINETGNTSNIVPGQQLGGHEVDLEHTVAAPVNNTSTILHGGNQPATGSRSGNLIDRLLALLMG